ncbi:hypothetical protein [Burkholderia pseudomallei]|uniref:hypothetical protein n=2 Tax=Burkholderia pseudomallei TaxID=28450 RepID=UPI001E403ECD|nr:hypothetical protein [Burkholderia pseudomallei]
MRSMNMKKNITEAGKVDIESLKKAVGALESPKVKRDRERAELFTELYEGIRDKLNADVSKSAIVKTLAECGLSINIKIFDELLEAEAKRRGEPVPGKVADDAAAVESDSAQQASAYEEGS